MTSKISIISDAYFQLGKSPITTLSPQSFLDVGTSNIYDRVIPAILGTMDYPFARKHAVLNKNSISPPDENYKNSFFFPNDLLAFVNFELPTYNFFYKIMGTELWTNEEEVKIYYSYESTTTLFPPSFSLYLVYLICAHIAYPITQKENVQLYWEKKSTEYYGISTSVITNQEPAKVIPHEPFLNAFRSG